MSTEKIKPMRESAERGRNVEIVLEPMRHGVRDPDGHLTQLGKDLTAERGQLASEEFANFDAVKAIGSTARPKGVSEADARSLVTADIYAKQMAASEGFTARKEERLNYGTIKSKDPYDHVALYNGALDDLLAPRGMSHKNFNELSLDEQRAFSHEAQKVTLKAAMDTTGPEAEIWKKEVAGAFADIIRHYMYQTKYLKNGSKVHYPAGTHGGSMEWLLQQALVWSDKEGKTHRGILSSEEFDAIGGPFDSSESYRVTIRTDKNGDLIVPFPVQFTNSARPQGEMYLDMAKLAELADHFEALHADDDRRGLDNLRMYK